YTIDVTAGTYDIELRVASLSSGGTLHLEFDGVDRTGPVTFGATGGWQEWITVRIEDVTLSGGIQTLRVVQDTDGFNLNWIRIVPPPDGDADGVPDREDLCVVSDLSPTVVIDGCDSGTPNLLGADGCTFSDDIAGAAAAAPNHGQFVSAVTRLMNRARRARLIRGDQGGAVVSCAARSDLPHRMSPRPQEILPTLSVAPSAPGRQGNGNRGSRGNRSPG
ncbi:MAG: carbohydrate-binding protein, partial [Acidobacteria bacterium]|nr:carbohydrate-binding protein [Acidobacteriota bacterium]NIM63353.1 carbohydrate-binding protein [Acidobacteriota bacterium]NIO60092.1 carbohydrate-binding protein [Acidobacteriota bacterium]NIQ86785.1 carbohydrate-binding protein [Acidobacteriota bacterium]NIT12124.1 carbohydrate-binding protein [Acidobacteriota bacterium]